VQLGRRPVVAALLAAVLVGGLSSGPAEAGPGAPQPPAGGIRNPGRGSVDPRNAAAAAQAERKLRARTAVAPAIRTGANGLVSSIVARPGHPLDGPRPSILAVEAPDASARRFLDEYGAAVGLQDGAASLTTRTVKQTRGGSVVHLEQTADGIPVLGGGLAVATDTTGRILSVTGEVSPEPAQPSTAQPPTARSGTAAPGTASPATAAPGTAAPGTAGPRTAPSGTASPGTAAPGTAAPGTAAPGTAGPRTASPATASPETSAPETVAPGTAASGTARPETAQPNAGVQPAAISKTAAIRTAIAAVHRQAPRTPLTATAEQGMFDPDLIGAPGPRGLRRVWQIDVTGPGVHKLVLIDARRGTISLSIDQEEHARDRRVCDYGGGTPPDDIAVCDATDTNIARVENGAESSVEDVNDAYEFTGATYDFYQSNFGRDSIDAAGMTIASSVRVCFSGGECPYPNAFWDGDKMVFGSGFAGADDIVGHELTHGVVERTAGLFYGYQSGAINESFADVMGEFIDQTYLGTSTDGPSQDWLVGEDLPSSVGVLRSMADPPSFGDPDRMTSDLYRGESHFSDPSYPDDSGWVHANSGVGNKAAYLITAPGTRTFNGHEVTGLGVAKAAQVYYRALLLLTSGSDYADLAVALDASCTQLAGSGAPPAGLVQADCVQVRAATAAVDMSLDPLAPEAQALDAAHCPTGAATAVRASDGFEDTHAGWSLTGDATEGFDFAGDYVHTGKWALSAATGDTGSPVHQSATWQAVAVPNDRSTYLWFAHTYTFEAFEGEYYDGGRVEYQLDGDGTWTDAGSLFVTNGYNVTLKPGAGTGRFFGGDSHGYTSSRVDLTTLRGHSVQLRFSTYADSEIPSSWLIDDVEVYTCAGAANGPARMVSVTGNGPSAAAISWLPPEVTGPSAPTSYRIAAVNSTVGGLPVLITPAGKFRVTASGLVGGTIFSVTPYLGSTPGVATTEAVKASTVTLASSAATMTYGRSVTLTGNVRVLGGGSAAGTATLFSRRKGATAWATGGTAPISAAGRFTFTVSPRADYEYVAHASGGPNVLGSGSWIRPVSVAPQVGIHPSAARVARNHSVRFTGGTTPARRSVAVYLHVLQGGKWQFVSSARTAASGTYAIAVPMRTPGRFTYRVVVAGDASYATGTSTGAAITIR
jgi:bacillolysin